MPLVKNNNEVEKNNGRDNFVFIRAVFVFIVRVKIGKILVIANIFEKCFWGFSHSYNFASEPSPIVTSSANAPANAPANSLKSPNRLLRARIST